jgi:uncharacterized cupredoxin-like copper-binding protein
MSFARPAALLVAAALAASRASADGGPRQPERPFDPARAEQKEFGIAGDPAKVTMSIGLAMLDTMRFVPDRIEVRVGENVRLMVRNNGKVQHEMVLGTLEELRRHGEFYYGCLVPGHFEAGMLGKIVVR